MAWKRIEPPKKKTDWPGCKLLIKERPPAMSEKLANNLALVGCVTRLSRRLNAQDTMNTAMDVAHWGKIRVLKLEWQCPSCEATHICIVPESWISEGKAEFVEKVDTGAQDCSLGQ